MTHTVPTTGDDQLDGLLAVIVWSLIFALVLLTVALRRLNRLDVRMERAERTTDLLRAWQDGYDAASAAGASVEGA